MKPWLRLLAPLLLLPACPPAGDDDDAADDDDSSELRVDSVTPGEACEVHERLGSVTLWSSGQVDAAITRERAPLLGLPAFEAGDCVFHAYDAGACGACPPETFCRGDGECVPWPERFLDLAVEGSSEGASFSAEAGAQGFLSAAIEPGPRTWDLTVSVGGARFEVPGLRVLEPLQNLELVVQVDESWNYGDLDATWLPPERAGLVRTEIPINHHAQAGTFADCSAPASTGALHAPAEVIEPLAVITGLEFQGLTHVDIVRVETNLGCIEVAAGAWQYATPREE